ncbi:glycosyltransferase [candidate division KSB1 bacterium]|nr:glycosyltransferase [candidate division KSB1 bacterium]
MKMNILHIAPFNVAGVPITFVKAERQLGFNSRLITLAKNPRGYEEDICLDLPFLDFKGFTKFKRLIGGKSRTEITNQAPQLTEIPQKWIPNKIEKLFIVFREHFWKSKIENVLDQINIDQFDVIQLDGGIGFYRNGRDILELKRKGKKIICCYTGSDLRVRGVIPQIDAVSDLNVSVEFDHLSLHPKINHVFFPFDASNFKLVASKKDGKIHIGHSPTNRAAKGSDVIIPVVKELEKKYPAKLVLIENLPYKQALELKAQCHIFIDQLGDLGYGISGLESLAMGIPTCSCLAHGFDEKYPDNPFVVVDETNLEQRLVQLIKNKELRYKKGAEGREWVKQFHDPIKVVQQIRKLLLDE